MPPMGRLGDKALAAEDTHGCPICPHENVIGPATQGSPNVFANSKPALRKGDPGIHTPCCGENKWEANAGSSTVFINGMAAFRMGDVSKHCGGVGNLIEGSANVNVGG